MLGLLSRAIRKIAKSVIAVVLVIAIAYASGLSYIFWAMHQSPEAFGRVMKHFPGPAFMVVPFEPMWMKARAGHLQIGDTAPDFSLLKLDKSDRVQLSALYREKPVVLIFGSYT